ncbi:MAG: DUF2520 domain-containing protein [Bacteroidia bacterium]|nr:DUF2520 domain-containing protein [Bacteroidia bacterium]
MKLKIGFIGSGNVAWHLAHALDSAGHTISQVISRNENHAKELAGKFGAFFSNRLDTFDTRLDVCLICVSDDQIDQVINALPASTCIIAHTCGSQPLDVLQPASPNIGVFYPLQSFSKHKVVDMYKVPFLLEASNNRTFDRLESLADGISNKVSRANSETRLKYHLAAVFVNNFVNNLFDKAAQYLEASHLDFSVLKPIILETASKVQELTPKEAQTGPARRGDIETLTKHRKLLANHPRLLELYDFLSSDLGQSEE